MDIRPSAPLTYHITEMMRKEKESVDIALEERERRLLAIYANRASSEVLVADLQVDYNLSDESVLKVIRRLEDEGKIRKQSKKTRRYDKINDEDDLRVIHSQLSNPRQQKKFP
jgi:DNA-binding transcriptional ArsR family regulator